MTANPKGGEQAQQGRRSAAAAAPANASNPPSKNPGGSLDRSVPFLPPLPSNCSSGCAAVGGTPLPLLCAGLGRGVLVLRPTNCTGNQTEEKRQQGWSG